MRYQASLTEGDHFQLCLNMQLSYITQIFNADVASRFVIKCDIVYDFAIFNFVREIIDFLSARLANG